LPHTNQHLLSKSSFNVGFDLSLLVWLYILSFFLYFHGTGVWTQALMHVRQELYHQPCFMLGIFEIGSQE
jgi:hypothetical protein